MKRLSEGNDLRLAQLALTGDADAWRELVDTLGPRIFAIALQFGHQRSRAEDLTQDVFLKLYQNLHKYRGDVPLTAWALRVSRNLCIDEYRRHRQERTVQFVPSEILDSIALQADPSIALERREVLAQVTMVLRNMDEKLALLITLRDLHGLTYEEISQLLGMPQGTIKSRLHRGRRELVKRLGERWDRGDRRRAHRLLEAAAC